MNISELWTMILKQLQYPTGNGIQAEQEGAESSGNWMARIVTRGRQLAHSAEQIVHKFL